MAGKHQPKSWPDAPDPARSYERAKPECESGMGKLEDELETPLNKPDGHQNASHRKPPSQQINAGNDPPA